MKKIFCTCDVLRRFSHQTEYVNWEAKEPCECMITDSEHNLEKMKVNEIQVGNKRGVPFPGKLTCYAKKPDMTEIDHIASFVYSDTPREELEDARQRIESAKKAGLLWEDNPYDPMMSNFGTGIKMKGDFECRINDRVFKAEKVHIMGSHQFQIY